MKRVSAVVVTLSNSELLSPPWAASLLFLIDLSLPCEWLILHKEAKKASLIAFLSWRSDSNMANSYC